MLWEMKSHPPATSIAPNTFRHPLTPALSDALILELVEIAREEWGRSLTQEEAAKLGQWLLVTYQALLETS